MPEIALTSKQVRRRLGNISESQFRAIEPHLIARGLQRTKINSASLYRESSLDFVLKDLFENEDFIDARKSRNSG